MPYGTPDQWKAALEEIGMVDYLKDNQIPATLDEALADGNWEVMLHQFAASEFSAENIDFLRAVAVFEASGDIGQAEQIYAQFVSANAATQVNLPGSTREALDAMFGEGGTGHGPPDLFDAAKNDIKKMTTNDTFRRFTAGATAAQNALGADHDWDAVQTRERS